MLSFRSYHLDGTLWGHPTKGVLEYEQEHTEGPYMAKFTFQSGEGGVDDNGLKGWFRNRLMTEIAAMSEGVEVWRGYVWEMELELDGKIRVKSMADMSNAVKGRYTNTGGDSITTGWYVNDESVTRYGRKEKVVSSSSSSGDEALERAGAELQYSSSPYTKTIVRVEPEENVLRVTLAGRIVLANNIILLADALRDAVGEDDPGPFVYNTATTVSEEIERILTAVNYNSGWLYPLDIQENDTVTFSGASSDIGAWDRIVELGRLRDSKGVFYRLQVTNDGGVIYRPYVEVEDYIHYPGSRGLQDLMSEVPTWGAKPGFIRDLDDRSGAGMPDTWLNDSQLSFYERTVMRDKAVVAEFHGKDLDVGDVYGAMETNRKRMEKPKEKAKKEPKEELGGNPWDWRFEK